MSSQTTIPSALGAFDSRHTPCLRSDVLVIGAGIAGCAAALHAADAGRSVLMITKAPFTETNSAWAQGGVAAVVDDEDSLALHLQDTLRVGAGLSEAETARAIISESPTVISWMQSLGVAFDRGTDGALSLSREGGHSVNRVVHQGDATGTAIQSVLEQAVLAHPRITVRPGGHVRDLISHEGHCVGAFARFVDHELAVDARAVVLATGGAGQLFRETTNPIGASGDGVALAFRAGARVRDMEFVQFHPTTLYIAGASRFLISEVVRGAGAVLRDRHGTQFMVGQHPSADLAPRDVVSRAILQRMVDTGDTHVYLDLTDVADPHGAFPTISRICGSFDIDIARDLIPVRPGAHYFIGGVIADADGRTDLPGLFAAGEVAATCFHGANRLASNSLLEGAVVGRRAGLAAAELAADRGPGLPNTSPGLPIIENAPRIHLDDLLYSLKSLMWRNVGLSRDAAGLEEAEHRIGLWQHYLMRANPQTAAGAELSNMLLVSALATVAARTRTESRGTHFRADHPERNDADWCRRVVLGRAEDGTIATSLSEIETPSDQVTA